MTKPPHEIDKAKVLRVADLSGTVPTGATRHVVDGRVVGNFAALAIVQYETETAVYLFYCDAEWNAITDTFHDNIDGAVAQAEFEFGPLKFIDASDER